MITHPILSTTVVDQPLIQFGQAVCGDLGAGLRREWLVTNGLGGYASGTLAGINTRRYHGLLVAALAPPVERTVLVAGLVEWARYQERAYPLSAHEYAGGTIDPHGYRYVQAFRLEGTLPVWTFALGDALLERRVWMAYAENTSYVQYRLVRGSSDLELELTPLTTYRDFHALSAGGGWQPGMQPQAQGCTLHWGDGARPCQLLIDHGVFIPGGAWYWNFHHREEAARGLDDRADLFAPGRFIGVLSPGESITLVLSAEEHPSRDSARALGAARTRQRELLLQASAVQEPACIQQLVLAADQFIVRRQAAGAGQNGQHPPLQAGQTVIAGYHWFNDWGRDTMIALPGLTCATGRLDSAADILRTFAHYVVDGLLPNNFPDRSGTAPDYNTVDATLWYVLAVKAYADAGGEAALVDGLLPVLQEIVHWHVLGTRYGIGVDPADGLLRAGVPGLQLTWMDAKLGDWVVTPRIGKPVEINALWYNALRSVQALLRERGDPAAAELAALAQRVRATFRARFLRPEHDHLADVVDGPHGDELVLRPNQIFAVSLPYPLLEGAEAERVVQAVGRALLTGYGLRSLSPDDPSYRGDYGGDAYRRDSGYHQGPVWSWLIGAYVEAYQRVYRDPAATRALLAPLEQHLHDAGLGTVSEILEGDAPHLPRGCIAQAWSVAELLRVWRRLHTPGGGWAREETHGEC